MASEPYRVYQHRDGRALLGSKLHLGRRGGVATSACVRICRANRRDVVIAVSVRTLRVGLRGSGTGSPRGGR
jgi:hypothetical protein